MFELESLKQEFDGRDKRLCQLLEDRNQAAQVMQEASQTTKVNNQLTKEIHENKHEKITLNSQLLEEKRKNKEFESLLHDNYEKHLLAKEQVQALQREVQEERDVRVKIEVIGPG